MSASASSRDALCRLCLSRARLQPIFGADQPDLADRIHACVSVQVKEDDALPTKVCHKCLDNVNNWHLFKTVCEKSQTKLEGLTNQEVQLKIKSEPLTDEAYDDGVIIDGNYAEYDQGEAASKLQPEGPPILASLGLAPRSDKMVDSEREDEEDDLPLARPAQPEVSVTVMRPTGELLQARQNIQQLASKNCLVCGRAYRYSHNARRHELSSHCFDRYTNKIVKSMRPQQQQKLRPNPFNPKARLMPNPINPKIKLMPHSRQGSKMLNSQAQPKSAPINHLPYPLKVKTLTDLQQKKKEPQILKSLLTARAKAMVHDRELIHSGPESPETLISEPEIASFQVETILSEPDAFVNDQENDNEEELEDQTVQNYDTVAMDSEQEMEIAHQESSDSHKNGDVLERDLEEEEEQVQQQYEEDEKSSGKESLTNTEAIIENGIGDHNDEEDVERAEEDMQEYDEEILPIAPIVEINELPQSNFEGEAANEGLDDDTGDVADLEDPSAIEDHSALEDPSALEDQSLLEPQEQAESKQYLTKVQRDFLMKNRDLIEQINTKSCKCCQVTYNRRKEVIQHLQKQGYKVPKHTCYNCVVTFGHIGALLSHMRANACNDVWKLIYEEEIPEDMVQDKPEAKILYKDILNARSYACKLCPAKFQLKQVIMKHVLDVHEDGQSLVPLACVHCGYRFKENRLWKKHIRNGECTVSIACDLCAEKFQSILEFNDHAVAAHAGTFDGNEKTSQVDSRPTDCPICQKPHPNYHNLVKHLRSFHGEDAPHFCTHCDAKFEQIADLNQHIYSQHSERHAAAPDLGIVKQEAEEYHYSCTECNDIFETVDAWTDHQIAEHNQVAHHCDQCDKKYLRPSELAEHKKTHLRMKLYSCVACQSSFQSPQRLADHVEQVHPGTPESITPDNQFYCEMCVRGFKSRQAYSNHMRIHSKVPTTNRRPGDPKPKPVVQPYVHFPAPPRNQLSVPNAPYSCDICGKGFMHKKNIWKHKKVLHADIVGGDKPDSEDNTMHASTEGEDDSQQDSGRLSIPQFNSFNFSTYAPPAPAAKPSPQQPQQSQLFACEMCGKKFPLKTSLWKHKRAKHGVINPSKQQQPMQGGAEAAGSRSSCTICKITFADKKSYYRHRKNVHKSNVQMCKICGKPLSSTLELYEHLKAAHARELLGYNAASAPRHDDAADATDDNGDYHARYPCDMCGKQFVGMLALQNHQCVSDATPQQPATFDCEICDKSYTSIAALKSHRGWHLRSPDGKAAANNSGLWMPHNKPFQVATKHSKHEVLEPPPAPRSATLAAAAKRRLPEVQLTVVPPKKLRPDEAMSQADVLSHLAQRSQPAEPDDRYCAICDKEFTKKAAYQRHMDEVHRPNSVFCPVCDKSFTRKSTLLVHMRKHYEDGGDGAEGVAGTSGEDGEVYPCDLCGAQYRSGKALRAHKARHHGEPDDESDDGEASPPAPGEFTCGQCGEGVATPRDLLAHRTIHATPTKFFCQVCKAYFARALDLSRHTRLRHADNEKVFFPCAMCDRFYMNKKSLQRHIETTH